MRSALTIAGSDCSGGAGIQADIKTLTANGVYAMSAITALTAQNTTGIRSIMEVTAQFLADQLDMIFEDIFPDAVKLGMILSGEHIEVICAKLKRYGAKNIVVDPVMSATSGLSFIKGCEAAYLAEKLLPICTVTTPNIPEAEVLSGMKIGCGADMETSARLIGDRYGCAVLLKGGHSENNADDLLYSDGKFTWLSGKRIDNPNTHGTGCTLSSAIAAYLANGASLEGAVRGAKEYVSRALSAMLDLGKGCGPLDHINKGEL